jgi:2-oxoglutarate dehydrogenase E2 component (dihydrolipoamide succinyltransferase)
VRHFSALTVIPLESLGDSISSAVLVSWEKNEGDQVNEDDVIAVVETDKVTMDIRAKQTGVFSGGFCAEGDEVRSTDILSLSELFMFFVCSFLTD